MLTASELHRRGLDASNAGRHAAARAIFRRALPRAEDPDTRARIEVSLAHVEAELGTPELGFDLCMKAAENPELSPEVRGLALAQLGMLQMRTGDGWSALDSFSRALPAVEGMDLDTARIHLHRGNVFLQRGEADRAAEDFSEAVSRFAKAELPREVGKAQHNLGYSRLLAGDLVSALSMMDSARAALADQSPTYRAICDQDRAEVFVAAGMVSDAEEALRSAAHAFGVRRLRQRQGEAEVVLARMLLRDDRADAARIARRAKRRFLSRGSAAWAARAEAVELTARLEAGRGGERLRARAEELVGELLTHGLRREAQALALELVRHSVLVGDVDAASSAMARFTMRVSAPVDVRLLHREVRAELARARRRRGEALSHVRRGLADLHDWQSSFGSLDLQSSLVGHGRRLALQGMRLAVEDGRPEVVFEWSERARALAGRVTPVRPPSDPEAASELAELRSLQSDLTAAEQTGRPTAAVQRKVGELRRAIRQRQWYGAGSGEVIEPASMSDLSLGLGQDGAALVAYLGVDNRLVALTLTDEDAHTRDLGDLATVRQLLAGMQADLDMSATHLPSRLRTAVHDGLRARLDDLAQKLVTPLVDDLGDRRLVVVPSGVLAGVPWTLLPGYLGRSLTVPRSATSWLQSRRASEKASRALLVAGPRVDRAVEEVEVAAKAWSDCVVLRDGEATAARVGEMAGQVDVFHAAAHGRHSADNPLFSGLELEDGPWFGYDIDQLAAIPSTVILSACELGRSSVRWGEETIGMTVAWLHAGARTVIASPASVDDDVACYTLAATHHYLADGKPAADALAAAMAEVGGSVPAPFVCFGSGW